MVSVNAFYSDDTGLRLAEVKLGTVFGLKCCLNVTKRGRVSPCLKQQVISFFDKCDHLLPRQPEFESPKTSKIGYGALS